MAREKKLKLVITFPTTTAAMAMEEACESEQGRLIPIPREISGSCGFAWCAELQWEEELLQIITKNKIAYQEKRVILLY